MITPYDLAHLKATTCPDCGNPLGRDHTYLVTPDTLLSRLTYQPARHAPCARQKAVLEERKFIILWTVRVSDPIVPSYRYFEVLPGVQALHLHSPTVIDFYHTTTPGLVKLPDMTRPTREEIREAMTPAIRAAAQKAQSEDELDSISDAIASIYSYLPKV